MPHYKYRQIVVPAGNYIITCNIKYGFNLVITKPIKTPIKTIFRDLITVLNR